MESINLPHGARSLARIQSGQSSATPYRHDNYEFFFLEIPSEEIHQLLKSNSLSMHSSLVNGASGATICSPDQTFLLRQVQTSNLSMILLEGSLLDVSCSYLEMIKIVPKYPNLLPLLSKYPWEGDDLEEDGGGGILPLELRIDTLPYILEGSLKESLTILKEDLGAIPIGGHWRLIGDRYKENYLRDLMANFVIKGGDLLSLDIIPKKEECLPYLPSHCSMEIGEHILSLFMDDLGFLSKKMISQFFLDCLLRCRPVWTIDDLMEAWKFQMGQGAWGIKVRMEWIIGVGIVESNLVGLDVDDYLGTNILCNLCYVDDCQCCDKKNEKKSNSSIRNVLKEGDHIRVSYYPSHKLPLDTDELFKLLWERRKEWSLKQMEVYVQRSSKILRTKVRDVILKYGRIRGTTVTPKYNF